MSSLCVVCGSCGYVLVSYNLYGDGAIIAARCKCCFVFGLSSIVARGYYIAGFYCIVLYCDHVEEVGAIC